MKKKAASAVSDSAHDLAEDLRNDLAHLADDVSRVATEYIAPKAREMADYLTPRVRDAATNVADYVQPRAADLSRRAAEARDTLGPQIATFASDARDTLQPKLAQFAQGTKESIRPYLDQARDRVAPALDDAYARVQPIVDAGRERISAEVMPAINEMVDSVNALPQTQEAKERLTAARAALAGELTLPEEPRKRSVFGTFFKLLVAGGLIAGVVFAVRRFLAPEDSGWQAHEPSQPYVPSPVVTEDDASPSDSSEDSSDNGSPSDDTAPEDGSAEDASQSDSDPDTEDSASPYGLGSYVGDQPGPDFTIKGNERSMKYHVPGYGGYDRTIADVWFSSEDAAQAAGFTKAQR